ATLRNAANSAAAVATIPSVVDPEAYPSTPTTAKTRPTACANRGGASSSRSAGGPRRGCTATRYSAPEGENRSPNNAPAANTTACAASNGHQLVISTTASTTVVIPAANRGPRGSICWLVDITRSYGVFPAGGSGVHHVDVRSVLRQMRLQGRQQAIRLR